MALGTSSTTALAGNTTFSFASLTGKPTTLAGYGITDGYSNSKVDARISAASIQYLTDVATVSASDDGKILYYDHSATSFKWKTDAAGGGTISALTDTTISGASNGQVLKYNGSAWVNGTDAGGIALTDLSVGAEGSASGDGAIAYNNGTGVFTYTPPTAAGIGV